MRRVCSSVNAPSSQKTSQKSRRVGESESGEESGQHFIDEQIHVIIGAIFVLGGNGVRAQERGNQLDGLLGLQAADRVEHLEFGGRLEAIAGLGLGGRRAVRQHPRQARALVCATSSSSDAARVARTVDMMPPPAAMISMYVLPATRISNSPARSPAQTTCVCGSTKPGMTTRPVASISAPPSIAGAVRRSARRRRCTHPARPVRRLDQAQVAQARAALRAAVSSGDGAELGSVRDEQIYVSHSRKKTETMQAQDAPRTRIRFSRVNRLRSALGSRIGRTGEDRFQMQALRPRSQRVA